MLEFRESLLAIDYDIRISLLSDERFWGRWADAQFDGTLEAVDRGIDAMIQLVAAFDIAEGVEQVQEVLDDLEGTAFATTREMCKVLALDLTRPVPPPFSASNVLVETVGQYIWFVPDVAIDAIRAGAELFLRAAYETLFPKALSEIDHDYAEWVTPRLMNHLIYQYLDEAYDEEYIDEDD